MGEETNIFRPVYRELSEDEASLLNDIKDKAFELYKMLDGKEMPKPSEEARLMALAKTALEQSIMWAVKSITS